MEHRYDSNIVVTKFHVYKLLHCKLVFRIVSFWLKSETETLPDLRSKRNGKEYHNVPFLSPNSILDEVLQLSLEFVIKFM